jgi:hypothetical protein
MSPMRDPWEKDSETYTVPSRTNMSCRGSFIKFLHSQSMRKPTLTGEFVAGSVDGRAILWDLWEEKRSSRPPLDGTQFRFCDVLWVLHLLEG